MDCFQKCFVLEARAVIVTLRHNTDSETVHIVKSAERNACTGGGKPEKQVNHDDNRTASWTRATKFCKWTTDHATDTAWYVHETSYEEETAAMCTLDNQLASNSNQPYSLSLPTCHPQCDAVSLRHEDDNPGNLSPIYLLFDCTYWIQFWGTALDSLIRIL